MRMRRDGRTRYRRVPGGLPPWLFEAVAAAAFLVAAPLGVFFGVALLVRVAALVGLPGQLVVWLAGAALVFGPFMLAVLISANRTGRRDTPRPRSGWLARLDPRQPSDAEIRAAADAALAHFGGDAGRAAVWARAEAIRHLEAGDLDRNLAAVRLMRALVTRAGR